MTSLEISQNSCFNNVQAAFRFTNGETKYGAISYFKKDEPGTLYLIQLNHMQAYEKFKEEGNYEGMMSQLEPFNPADVVTCWINIPSDQMA